ncbi:VOC family protein [Allokutzneria albata]|uniref:Methylmalonyl-CoA epimerase n=1 Tax=Allokutzneria albata TaxID=211114 RepID=A0A1H0APS0_ALLAB|nr:VOC family protein [Allokutzneria albata]SDN35540.1 methylmalonyl-CoA epimerase [Allokutzneria albata]
MILGIDHVGVAVKDPEAAGKLLTALGMAQGETGTADEYGVACEFWGLSGKPDEVTVELVSPTREDSTVQSQLAKKGPGAYHVALEVDDIAAEMERLRSQGFVQLDAEPCAGAREGMQVAFFYLGRAAGFLVELVQYDKPRRATS